MREIPKPGQIYRHFKGHLYQIVTIARHSETLEALVIYQALYGDFQVYARPLHMFMSELDREKYSDVKQRERFELVRTANEITMEEMQEPVQTSQVVNEIIAEPALETAPQPEVNPQAAQLDVGLEEFLDADSFEERLRIFTGMQHRLTDDMINIMAISLDTEVPEGELGDRIASLKNFLLMQVKYECNRIR
ncbi:MAG: DUF1653 domain-containing protein [Lachnospiraceae bacterium]|nr:DUF1653 domain-containing protein [Lachnospiraceae bacterium]